MNFGIFSEIVSTLKRNKLRTFLTGFSISWGIFMLIVLLSAGNGLKNSVTSNFDDDTKNVVEIYSGYTTIEYEGYQKGRRITMDYRDSILLANSFPEVENVIPAFNVPGKTISYGKKSYPAAIEAVVPNHFPFLRIEMKEGRFVNNTDNRDLKKYIIIADKDARLLFGNEDVIGKYVTVDELVYQIIGIYKNTNPWENSAYIPYSTAMNIYNPGKTFDHFSLMIGGLTTLEENTAFNERLRYRLSKLHDYDKNDKNAINIWNQLQGYMQTLAIFRGINIFIWIIGIGTLIAGIVGISNIMLITVRERTREFGIRKALGAKPASILRLVMLESLVITTFFGYLGMIIGMGISKVMGIIVSAAGDTSGLSVFKDPSVDLGLMMSATLVLIIAGVLAGYFPAKRAVSVKPVEALRYE
mgnify:CR=1 FL=1